MFTYEELRLIRIAVETEIIRREESKSIGAKQKLDAYNKLMDKLTELINEMR